MRNKWLIIISVIIIVGGIFWGLFSFSSYQNPPIANYKECVARGYEILESFPQQCRSPKGEIFTEDIGNALEKANLIRLSSPSPNQSINTSPFVIEGEALGNWFFEGSFQVDIVSSEGNAIYGGIAEADGEWMTEEFVPFSATIGLETEFKGGANLVLHRENPSGDPELNESLIVPIWIDIPVENMDIKIYFGKYTDSSDTDPCNIVYPVTRSVVRTSIKERDAIKELLKGPNEEESANGFFTSLPSNVNLNSINIVNDEIEVDFSANLEEGVGGSCRVTAIRSQITETLKQFPFVSRVIISINGHTEDILQP